MKSEVEAWCEWAREVITVSEGRPFFIYSESKLLSNCRAIRTVLSQAVSGKPDFYYSMKTNPNREIVKLVTDLGWGLDVSGEREMIAARSLVPSSRIQFSGCAKEVSALKRSVELRLQRHHVDSLDEWNWFVNNRVVESVGLSLRLSAEALTQFSKEFGIELPGEMADAFALKHGLSSEEIIVILTDALEKREKLTGLHFYLGREQFEFERLRILIEVLAQLRRRHIDAFRENARFSIGPGLPIHFEDSARAAPVLLPFTQSGIDFELGRSLVGSAGIYGAQVLSVKKWENGRVTVIVNGGVQHVGSSLRPLYSENEDREAIELSVLRGAKREVWFSSKTDPGQPATVFGSLCLGHDILLAKTQLPIDISRGDWILFYNAGAYGLTAGVPRFIHQDLPLEYMGCDAGKLNDVSHHDFGAYDLINLQGGKREGTP